MKKLVLYSLLLIAFSSCETVVQLPLEEGDKNLVVESYLEFSKETNTGFAKVYLTESSAFYGNDEPIPVSNASVSLNNTYPLIEDPDSMGYYTSQVPIPYQGEAEFELSITAQIDGKEGQWMAKDSYTEIPNIDSIYYVYVPESPPFQEEGYYAKIMLIDPLDETNFYHLDVFINDTISFELNGGTKRSSILRDEYSNGSALDFEVNDEPLMQGEKLLVRLSSITEDIYFYYFNLYTLLTETSGIGAPPPFPLYGNVVSLNENFGNALGNFQVRSFTQKEIVVTDE